jgi:tryptophanyl-tRNA synthetase
MVDEPKEIERSIKRAVTDSGNEIRFSDDPEKAGVNNLLGIYQVITDKSKSEVETDFSDAVGYGVLKARVAEAVITELTPIREKFNYLMGDITELDRLLQRGADQARAVSRPKLNEVKRRIGLTLAEGS